MAAPQSTAAMPPMMYGTAWKKERTADLVYEAIKAGFRGIDTAAMKKHYDEALAGEGIRRAIREGIVSRKDLFIQTKYTPHDPSSPGFSPTAPIPSQIHTSLLSSLTNLTTPDQPADAVYIDALILHSPLPSIPQTLEAWAALQSYLPSSPDPSRRGKILRLGISNVTLPILQALSSYPGLASPPVVVQNRFRGSERQWDREVRAWVVAQQQQRRQGGGASGEVVRYQGFWTLTGNVAVWQQQQQQQEGGGFVQDLAQGAGVSLAAAWYVLVMEAGVVVLNGTGHQGHMREDLEAADKVAAWRGTEEGGRVWQRCWGRFEALIGG
ncbi:NADP-dependent oxidoreductase domain-containing protein [Chaetomidium leptoderma]|uniref:NADP-dependent oxidoreductase domain-containing protein n=1 Tax=Chaetomidium leptoderma TaxID=669021 RepID=A0AAN7A095_9PEZI|nr:NADP-dependent oxidoreductase domain-containing protein [Chaetomidium leptoderma]